MAGGSINKVTIMGRLGRDPEVRTFQDGGKIINLSICTSEKWKDRNTGEQKERQQWHNVVIKNKGFVTLVERYARKGKRILIEGSLETRKWQDQSGQDRYTTEVVVKPYKGDVEIIDWPDDSGASPSPSDSGSPSGYDQGATGDNVLDDEIPF